MGFMYYGSQSHELEIDDRPLAHLKIALLSLLRAGHSVAFSTSRPAGQGSGRETLWISPATDLRFRFVDGRCAPSSALPIRPLACGFARSRPTRTRWPPDATDAPDAPDAPDASFRSPLR